MTVNLDQLSVAVAGRVPKLTVGVLAVGQPVGTLTVTDESIRWAPRWLARTLRIPPFECQRPDVRAVSDLPHRGTLGFGPLTVALDRDRRVCFVGPDREHLAASVEAWPRGDV